mmetsp:Transcript_17992/g.44617  ORF Transcript_17992/g.44617 Transcript_17992/m.44617 type:complete len:369 (+) Transcript_17992:3396-4502(+)
MSKLRRGVDELELDLLDSAAVGSWNNGLPESNSSLLGTSYATLQHKEGMLNGAVVREASEGVDSLFRQVKLGGRSLRISTLSDQVHLLVDLGPVMISVLTRSSDRVLYLGGMPCADTSNLTETSMGLTRKTGRTPTSRNTFVSMSFRDGDGIDHFRLLEKFFSLDLLLKEALGKVNLISNRAAIHLNLHKVGLLLSKGKHGRLGVGEDAHYLAVLLHFVNLLANELVILRSLLCVLRKGLLLGIVPVLVEAAFKLIVKMVCPHCLVSAKALRGLSIPYYANNNHRRSLNESDGFDNLLFMGLRTRLVNVTCNVSHSSLVTHESGEVGLLSSIVAREGLHLALMATAALAGKKPKRPMAGSRKLTMRHA